MHKGRTISANCEDQKTEDVDATELKKGSAEAAVCPYKTRVLKLQSTFFFLEDICSKTTNLIQINADLTLNPRLASEDPELRFHFFLKSKLYRSHHSTWVLEGTII